MIAAFSLPRKRLEEGVHHFSRTISHRTLQGYGLPLQKLSICVIIKNTYLPSVYNQQEMPSGDSWKKKYQLWIPRYGKMKMSRIASEKLAHSSPPYSLPLGSIFCLSTCAASCRVAGICFSAPRTAIGWQPGRQREPELGAATQPNKYLLSTCWGQAQWRIQRFMWSGPSNNLISSGH